jgi:hypothetical protein
VLGRKPFVGGAGFYSDDTGLNYGQQTIEFTPTIESVGDGDTEIEPINMDPEPAIAAIDASFGRDCAILVPLPCKCGVLPRQSFGRGRYERGVKLTRGPQSRVRTSRDR